VLQTSAYCLSIAAITCLASMTAHAGEDFQVRYNIAGSIGGEMFTPPDAAGLAVGVAATYIDIRKVTGNDGNTLTKPIPGGAIPLPSPTPVTAFPTYGANTAQIPASGTFKLFNLGVGYITNADYGGGRFAFGGVLPYGVKSQSVRATAATPAVQANPAVPAAAQQAIASQFGATYQSNLAGEAASSSGDVSGIGDLELQGGWLYTTEQLRVLLGASLVIPTGRYNASPAPDIGTGNFYTLRPSVQVAYLPTPDIAFAAKATLGLNTKNRDNDLRSGNWIGLEGAAAYKTGIGVFGLHTVFVQQYQDDANNPWGPSRYRSLNAGAFYTAMVPGIDAALTLQYMATTSSRNAKVGSMTQIRLIKLF